MSASLATFLIWLVVLFRQPLIGFGRLRLCEAFLTWATAGSMGYLRLLGLLHALALSVDEPGRGLLAAYAVAFTNVLWMSLIVIYGVFVPNTAEPRMQAGPGVRPVGYRHRGLVAPIAGGRGAVRSPCVLTLLMLFLARGTVLYGSFKIGSLQQEAFAARQQARRLGQYR